MLNILLILLSIFLIVVIIVLRKSIWYLTTIRYYIRNLSGPKPLPFIGNILEFRVKHLKDIFRKYDALFKQYGEIFKFWLGPVPIIMISDPNYARSILTNPSTLDKPWLIRYTWGPLLRKSFVLKLEHEWRPRRKIISSSLNQPIINSYVSLFVKESENLVKEMEKEVESGKIFDVHDYLNQTSLYTICGTSLGIDLRKTNHNFDEFFEAVHCIYRSILERLLKFWLIPQYIFERSSNGHLQKRYIDTIFNVTTQVLKDKRTKSEPNNTIDSNDHTQFQKGFLDFLLKIPNYGDDHIIDDATFLILAGFESSSAIASYCLLVLAAKPEIQDKVYQEIFDQFENSDRTIQLEDLNNFDYLERVIRETLRLYPPVAYLERNNQETLKLDDTQLPANTHFIISIFHLHRDPKLWHSPLEFNPERFLPDSNAKRHPYAYIPFGQGPRMCPGSKHALTFIKIIIINILRNYQILTHLRLDELEFLLDISLELQNGHLVTIKRRVKNK